jgi:hypothetical protein
MPDDSEVSVEVEAAQSAAGATGAAGKDEDLALEIARSLPKNVREQITCKRVTKYHYRCNWWTLDDTASYDNPGMMGSIVTTGRIGQSEFLHVVKVAGELKIRVITR